jgi:hypothetical protein
VAEPDYVRLEALKNFDQFAVGDRIDAILDERWAHLVASDYMRIVGRWQILPTGSE